MAIFSRVESEKKKKEPQHMPPKNIGDEKAAEKVSYVSFSEPPYWARLEHFYLQ